MRTRERIRHAARRIVQSNAALFLARGERAVAAGRDDELHALRIAGKRLRYNLEFFSDLLGRDVATALGLLELVQDKLGDVADANAQSLVIDGLRRSLRAD